MMESTASSTVSAKAKKGRKKSGNYASKTVTRAKRHRLPSTEVEQRDEYGYDQQGLNTSRKVSATPAPSTAGQTSQRNRSKTPRPKGFKDPTKYEVERIIGAIYGEGCQWVLIRWAGWDMEDNTWERVTGLVECQQSVNKFYRDYGRPNSRRPKILTDEGKKHAALNYGPEDDYLFDYLPEDYEPPAACYKLSPAKKLRGSYYAS